MSLESGTRCTALLPASETRLISSTISCVSVVNTGGELQGLTLFKRKGKEPSGDTSLIALRKNSDAITLLQEGSLLTLAVLLSIYGKLKSLVKQPLHFHSKL